ncbi:hypothetical protein JTB14_029639 [Gonioctena quinquepunctata]|nr:hypothetical protein JTB14_029639 [Gonioctena quinquepunctata]
MRRKAVQSAQTIPAVKDPSCWPIYSLVCTIAIACYLNGLNGDFVHDDIPAVTINKDVLAINPVSHVFKNDFWGTPMADLNSHKSYRPLTTLTFRSKLHHATKKKRKTEYGRSIEKKKSRKSPSALDKNDPTKLVEHEEE